MNTYHNELTNVIKEIKQFTNHLGDKPLTSLDQIENYINNITSVLINTNVELEKKINEKNKLENELKEKEHFLESMLDTIPNPIFYKDENHNFIGCNKAFECLLGPAQEKITQKFLTELSLEKEILLQDTKIAHQLNHQAIQQSVSTVKDINGQLHDVLFNKAIFYNDDGSIAGVVGVLNDITEHIKLEKILTELSIKDDLTCLYNRRGFTELSNREWKYAIRNKSSIALMMIDIDHFKLYNDTYGHQAGDSCLKEVAYQIMHACKRPTDIVARYGGEEFIVLLPNTDKTGALIVAERLQAEINKMGLEHKTSPVAKCITVSIGVHSITPNRDDLINVAVKIADQNLYAAKNTGRNKIVS